MAGVDPGKNVNPEFGALASIAFAMEVFENVRLTSKIDLFNNYTDADRSNRKNTDVNWETTLNMKVNRFIINPFYSRGDSKSTHESVHDFRLSDYLMNIISRYFGNGHIWSSTKISSLSM